jgi:hypothetical protein
VPAKCNSSTKGERYTPCVVALCENWWPLCHSHTHAGFRWSYNHCCIWTTSAIWQNLICLSCFTIGYIVKEHSVQLLRSPNIRCNLVSGTARYIHTPKNTFSSHFFSRSVLLAVGTGATFYGRMIHKLVPQFKVSFWISVAVCCSLYWYAQPNVQSSNARRPLVRLWICRSLWISLPMYVSVVYIVLNRKWVILPREWQWGSWRIHVATNGALHWSVGWVPLPVLVEFPFSNNEDHVILPLCLCYKQLERFDIDLYRIFLTCYVRDISYHWQQPGTSYILLNTATIQLTTF